MARFLLDTDAVVDWGKGATTSVSLIRELLDRGEDLCSCAIVLTEVHSGLLPAEERATSALLESCEYLDISPASARQAGIWRRTIRPGGRSLSTADMLIAAAAVAYNATVVTGDVRDFPIPGLGLLELPRTNRRQSP